MKHVVVVASLANAGLFKDGTVRGILLDTDNLAYLASGSLRDEVVRHLKEVSLRAKIPLPTVQAILEDFILPGLLTTRRCRFSLRQPTG